jgi:hypothetical protein
MYNVPPQGFNTLYVEHSHPPLDVGVFDGVGVGLGDGDEQPPIALMIILLSLNGNEQEQIKVACNDGKLNICD